jgi:hypothetical protein
LGKFILTVVSPPKIILLKVIIELIAYEALFDDIAEFIRYFL